MNLSDMITRVGDDANLNTSITSVSNRIVREINRVCQEEWEGFRWSFRWRNYRITTDTDVTTGTITATNGSRTITGAGTSFLSTHKTWHIYFPSDSIQNWYKIRAYTSGTQLELDVPYQGTTGSLKTYVLRHFDYVLPTEAWDLGSLIATWDNRPVPIFDIFGLELAGPTPLYKGYPVAVGIISSDTAPTVYSTGTLSGTLNTQILTGSATSWLANIYPGDLVTIGSYTYNVLSVDSDTQITLYQNQQVTSNGGTTYTITRQFGRILRILWPSTDNYTLDIRALRKYQPLVNNNDTNELLYRYSNAVALKVASLELASQNDVRDMESKATLAWSRARSDDDSLTTKNTAQGIFSYRMNRRYRERIVQ